MKIAYIIKQVLGYIFIAYALVGMGYSLILNFFPQASVLYSPASIFSLDYLSKYSDKVTSNVILLFGFSAIAGAILLTNNPKIKQ